MTFSQIMNSKLLYILVIAAIAYVLVFSVLTLIRSWKHGQEIGLSKEKLKGAIISSAIYSILPSISIIICFSPRERFSGLIVTCLSAGGS